MFVRISISRSFTKSQWASFSTWTIPYNEQKILIIATFDRLLPAYPRILSRANIFAAQLHKLSAADHSERNMIIHRAVDFLDSLVVCWEVVNLDIVCLQLFVDFRLKFDFQLFDYQLKFSLYGLTLNFWSSVLEMVSALAMIGMILTLVSSFFMQTRSKDFNPCPVGQMKYKQMWIRLSW